MTFKFTEKLGESRDFHFFLHVDKWQTLLLCEAILKPPCSQLPLGQLPKIKHDNIHMSFIQTMHEGKTLSVSTFFV